MDRSVLDNKVRLEIYRHFVDQGHPPVAAEVANALRESSAEIEGSFKRLADAHVIVLAPQTPYIWLANPLSALPSPFRVEVEGRDRWGICIWDALGILAMLDKDGTLSTFCPDCDEPLRLDVRDGKVNHSDEVVHFSVPAARFWDDIGFT